MYRVATVARAHVAPPQWTKGHQIEDASAMEREVPARPVPNSVALSVTTAAMAAAIFVVDTIAPIDIAIAVLYVAVVLVAARFLRRRGVLLVASACIVLAVVSPFLSRQGPLSTIAL